MNKKIIIWIMIIVISVLFGIFTVKKLNSNTQTNENNFSGKETSITEGKMQEKENKENIEKNDKEEGNDNM